MAHTLAQAQTAAQAVAICAIISGMQLDSVARATAAATLIQFALPALCLQLNFLWLPLPPPHFPLLLLLLQLLSLYLLLLSFGMLISF